MERNRCLWAFMGFLVVETVFSQVVIEKVTGEDALLPCIYNNTAFKKVNIYWKKDIQTVYYISGGVPETSNQHKNYSGRVSGFLSEYEKGNFTLLFKNLTVTDSGTYRCINPDVDNPQKVLLTVKDKPVLPPVETADPKIDITPAGGSGSVMEHCLSVWLLSLLHILLPK